MYSLKDTNESLTLVQVTLETIPESVYKTYEYFENVVLRDYTIKNFPLSDGVLEYWQYIRSPVVKITTDVTDKYNMPAVLTLSADVLQASNE